MILTIKLMILNQNDFGCGVSIQVTIQNYIDFCLNTMRSNLPNVCVLVSISKNLRFKKLKLHGTSMNDDNKNCSPTPTLGVVHKLLVGPFLSTFIAQKMSGGQTVKKAKILSTQFKTKNQKSQDNFRHSEMNIQI